MKMTSFSQLLDVHREIDELFFAHQCSLLHYDFETALSQLKTYENALFEHMRDEEEILLPLYAERATIAIGAGPDIFLADHEKMRGFIMHFTKHTSDLAADPRPESGLLLLLDREAFYKRLCSHHDHRESAFLYPGLDSVTSEAEKAELFSLVTFTFDIEASVAAT